MHVGLLSTYSQPCGLATYAERLVPALRALDLQVSVIGPHLSGQEKDVLQPLQGEPVSRAWNRNRAFGFEAFLVARQLFERNVSIVHANVNLSLFSSRILYHLAKGLPRFGLPFLATWHGRDGGSWGRRFKVWRFHQAFKSVDLIVHNESHAREVRAAGIDRVHVIAHGLPPIMPPNRQTARAKLGLSQDARVFTHFGFLVPDKGILEMIVAIAKLRARGHNNLFYWISGAIYDSEDSRAYRRAIQEEIRRQRLEDQVFLGGDFVSKEDALMAMQAADWVVLNYHSGGDQGTSGAVTWAMASGSPVAVSPAAVFDDVRGVAHTLGGRLDDALERLLKDEQLAHDTTKAIGDFVDARSWEKIGARHKLLYERILSRSK